MSKILFKSNFEINAKPFIIKIIPKTNNKFELKISVKIEIKKLIPKIMSSAPRNFTIILFSAEYS